MANIIKNIGKSITHGSRAVHKARRAKRAGRKAVKAAKRGDIKKAEHKGVVAYKAGKQAIKQGTKAAKATKRAGKQVGRGAMALSKRDPAGVVKAGGFVE